MLPGFGVSCNVMYSTELSYTRLLYNVLYCSVQAVVFFSTCDSVEFHHALFEALCDQGESEGEDEGGRRGEEGSESEEGEERGEGGGEGYKGGASASNGTHPGHQKGTNKPNGRLSGARRAHRPSGSAASACASPSLPSLGIFKLHGSMPQRERSAAFLGFRSAPRGVLLCTDVAARGLDFPSVPLVLQYDPPGDPTDYVHRSVRKHYCMLCYSHDGSLMIGYAEELNEQYC